MPAWLNLICWANFIAEFGDKITFLTVSLDQEMKTIIRYRNEKGFKWTFLYNGMQYDLLKSYQVSTFPVFVLISADGKILQYPAYKPSEQIEDSFSSLLNPEK